MDGLSVSGEIVTAGTALAGLILIYIGALVTSYGGFDATEQKSVKGKFQQRAWLERKKIAGKTLELSVCGPSCRSNMGSTRSGEKRWRKMSKI